MEMIKTTVAFNNSILIREYTPSTIYNLYLIYHRFNFTKVVALFNATLPKFLQSIRINGARAAEAEFCSEINSSMQQFYVCKSE